MGRFRRAAQPTGDCFSITIARALRDELGDSHRAIKTVMAWTGASERTAKNWLGATYSPRGDHLVRLARHSDAVLEVFLTAAGRDSVLDAMRLVDARVTAAKVLAALVAFR
jgi:membrane protein required for beta-lactamase induction